MIVNFLESGQIWNQHSLMWYKLSRWVLICHFWWSYCNKQLHLPLRRVSQLWPLYKTKGLNGSHIGLGHNLLLFILNIHLPAPGQVSSQLWSMFLILNYALGMLPWIQMSEWCQGISYFKQLLFILKLVSFQCHFEWVRNSNNIMNVSLWSVSKK